MVVEDGRARWAAPSKARKVAEMGRVAAGGDGGGWPDERGRWDGEDVAAR
ncbi:UNVERIFIED_CONTAM: hypothetical protein Sradi_5425500 [Sesamum radiatum]|uniref:Uncharacterized protein n=1 Tax=Sesamum radiatum TaxID=300843 RepID=A0AAW2LBC0_SESRA